MTCVTPGCASTSRSNRRSPLSPRMSCRCGCRRAHCSLRRPVCLRGRRAVTPKDRASGRRRQSSICCRQSASRRARLFREPARGQHIDAAQEEPLVGQIPDRHRCLIGKIARWGDVTSLPCISAGYHEIGWHFAGQMETDREISQGWNGKINHIAVVHRTGCDNSQLRNRRSLSSRPSLRRSSDPSDATRSSRRR